MLSDSGLNGSRFVRFRQIREAFRQPKHTFRGRPGDEPTFRASAPRRRQALRQRITELAVGTRAARCARPQKRRVETRRYRLRALAESLRHRGILLYTAA